MSRVNKDCPSKYLAEVNTRYNETINYLKSLFASQLLNSGALAIKTAGSAVVKAGTAFYALVDGKLVTKANDTDMAALSGTVTADKFNVYCFYVDASGTLTSAMGTEGDALADVVFPARPDNVTMIGFVIINPTGTGDFVGGTTVLDSSVVVPNTVYVNTVGVIDADPENSIDTVSTTT